MAEHRLLHTLQKLGRFQFSGNTGGGSEDHSIFREDAVKLLKPEEKPWKIRNTLHSLKNGENTLTFLQR